ncbi:hypothetical protein EVJ58_g4234 [Rhodofomes roseus]|uniref:Uncharacterized protein n=1 Tax=Rhodofomes roseus TaxID=34475 RepID=A0A4Y9YIA6_9APHY|nr:hypothetical protein EVJ58_g4234 [Rhodofomes roseus]
MPRRPKGPPNPYPGLVRARLNAPSFLYGLLPGTQSVRSRDGLRDPNWQIDEGDEEGESLRMNGHAHQPSASSSTSVPLSVATSPYFNPQIEEEDEAEEQDHGYFPAPMHGRSTSASDSALLLRPERKDHSKSLWDRLVKYTDGLRKSPSYRSGRVRPLGAVQRSSRNLDDVPGEMLPPSSKSVPGWSASSRSLARPGMVAPSTTTLPPPPARTYSADHDAYDAHDALARAVEPDESVLLISKLPGQDFFIDDATTEHSAPLR